MYVGVYVNHKTKLKEGDELVVKGTLIRDTEIRKYSRAGNSDAIFTPSGWRKFFGKKVQLSLSRKENVFGKYVITIEGVDEP